MANKPTNQKPSRLILLKRYAFSAINLYGVIKLEDFIIVFNHFEKESLSEEEAIPLLNFYQALMRLTYPLNTGYLLMVIST